MFKKLALKSFLTLFIDVCKSNVRLIRHSRAGGNPGEGAKHWIPAEVYPVLDTGQE